jgi:hypothetical protein
LKNIFYSRFCEEIITDLRRIIADIRQNYRRSKSRRIADLRAVSIANFCEDISANL